jgi:hypothetical protein
LKARKLWRTGPPLAFTLKLSASASSRSFAALSD